VVGAVLMDRVGKQTVLTEEDHCDGLLESAVVKKHDVDEGQSERCGPRSALTHRREKWGEYRHATWADPPDCHEHAYVGWKFETGSVGALG
jgi:hypothetical protein